MNAAEQSNIWHNKKFYQPLCVKELFTISNCGSVIDILKKPHPTAPSEH